MKNLAVAQEPGCDIHSANRIVPDWQDVVVGAEVKLAPEVAMTVASVDPGHSLVLRGGIPLGTGPAPFDMTWSFVLREEPDGTTRLISRERYEYLRWWAPLVVVLIETGRGRIRVLRTDDLALVANGQLHPAPVSRPGAPP